MNLIEFFDLKPRTQWLDQVTFNFPICKGCPDEVSYIVDEGYDWAEHISCEPDCSKAAGYKIQMAELNAIEDNENFMTIINGLIPWHKLAVDGATIPLVHGTYQGFDLFGLMTAVLVRTAIEVRLYELSDQTRYILLGWFTECWGKYNRHHHPAYIKPFLMAILDDDKDNIYALGMEAIEKMAGIHGNSGEKNVVIEKARELLS